MRLLSNEKWSVEAVAVVWKADTSVRMFDLVSISCPMASCRFLSTARSVCITLYEICPGVQCWSCICECCLCDMPLLCFPDMHVKSTVIEPSYDKRDCRAGFVHYVWFTDCGFLRAIPEMSWLARKNLGSTYFLRRWFIGYPAVAQSFFSGDVTCHSSSAASCWPVKLQIAGWKPTHEIFLRWGGHNAKYHPCT